MTWLWGSLEIHALHNQLCHGSSVSPSSHCTAVVAHDFNYQCFHFQLFHLFVIFVNFALATHLFCKWWAEAQSEEMPKDTQEFYGKVTETLKHISYLGNLLFKWGFMHRSKWSAEQWKLEPVNLLVQSSAMCSHQLISSLTPVCSPAWCPGWYALVSAGPMS